MPSSSLKQILLSVRLKGPFEENRGNKLGNKLPRLRYCSLLVGVECNFLTLALARCSQVNTYLCAHSVVQECQRNCKGNVLSLLTRVRCATTNQCRKAIVLHGTRRCSYLSRPNLTSRWSVLFFHVFPMCLSPALMHLHPSFWYGTLNSWAAFDQTPGIQYDIDWECLL